MTRKGKIARLPRTIRDELNRRLDNGEPGSRLVGWLNELPEVKQMLETEFEGRAISEQNLSEWKNGGFRDWEAQQEVLYSMQELAADVKELPAVSSGEMAKCLESRLLALCASAMYRSLASNEDPQTRLRRLGEILRDMTQLQACHQKSEWLEIGWERLELQRQRTKTWSLLESEKLEIARERLAIARAKETQHQVIERGFPSSARRGDCFGQPGERSSIEGSIQREGRPELPESDQIKPNPTKSNLDFEKAGLEKGPSSQAGGSPAEAGAVQAEGAAKAPCMEPDTATQSDQIKPDQTKSDRILIFPGSQPRTETDSEKIESDKVAEDTAAASLPGNPSRSDQIKPLFNFSRLAERGPARVQTG